MEMKDKYSSLDYKIHELGNKLNSIHNNTIRNSREGRDKTKYGGDPNKNLTSGKENIESSKLIGELKNERIELKNRIRKLECNQNKSL